MHRNTYILVLFLAIVAALVVGLNIGKSMGGNQSIEPTSTIAVATATPIPTIGSMSYVNPTCGVSFVYPSTLKIQQSATTSAFFVSSIDQTDTVAVACQQDIPRPALVKEKIEAITIASMSATLYHDASSNDGTPIDAIYFTHPTNGLDIMISGTGASFPKIYTSMKLLE